LEHPELFWDRRECPVNRHFYFFPIPEMVGAAQPGGKCPSIGIGLKDEARLGGIHGPDSMPFA